MKNKRNGYTLVELVGALIVIAILAVISITSYRVAVKKGIATEGRNMLSDINMGEQSYRHRTGSFYVTTSAENKSTKLGVDFRKNKYFTSYTITKNDTTGKFTATTSAYNGKSLTLVGSTTSQPIITDDFSEQAE
ncbi:MAG: prepilin-type N-terminal cleavage/methylation domain-containing protein [Elusimicrobia bacterium]|nr:prepilin-type N-terminal cleavage/methylation domain-containing protein [Elusimicrobiota bacterium]